MSVSFAATDTVHIISPVCSPAPVKASKTSKKTGKISAENQENDHPNVQKVKKSSKKSTKAAVVEPDTKLYCKCQKLYDASAAPMIGCDMCCDWFHYDCIGLSEKSAKEAQAKPYFFCSDCDTNLQSDTTQALQKGLQKFLREFSHDELEEIQGKLCNKYKAKKDDRYAKLQEIFVDKAKLQEALIYHALSVGTVVFLSGLSTDKLKAFLKKKNLHVSGSKEELATRVYNVWYLPAPPAPMVYDTKTDISTFIIRSRMLELFYYEKFSQLCEEKQASNLSQTSLNNFMHQKHLSGISGSKKEKMILIRDNLLLVDEMRDFVSVISKDLTQAIIEPTIDDATTTTPELLKNSIAQYNIATLRHYSKRYGVSNKGLTKKSDIVDSVVASLLSSSLCTPAELVKCALVYGKQHAQKNPVSLFNLLCWTGKEILLQAFPASSWWCSKLSEVFAQVGELDITDRTSVLCHQIDPIVQVFVEISLGEAAELDSLLAGFDNFCISPGKKKAKEQAEIKLNKDKAKDKEKKKAAATLKKSKPKRNLSAYQYFSRDYRPVILKEHSSVSFGELAKILGAKWGCLSKEEKQPFEKSAEEDKVRYDNELEQWRKTQKPKKPVTAYTEFVKCQRANVASEGVSFADVSRKLGAMWKEISAEQRNVYQETAELDKIRYEAEMAAWFIAHPELIKEKKEKKVPAQEIKVEVKAEDSVKQEGAVACSVGAEDVDMPPLEKVVY